jgi:hypothetical protein
MRGRISIVEPSSDAILEAIVSAVEGLCIDAEADLRSPRYAFAFGTHADIEPVRQIVVDRGIATWRRGDEQLVTAWGQSVFLGSEVPKGWPLARVAVVCRGSFPTGALVKSMPLDTSVLLIFDPRDPPTARGELKRLADEANSGYFYAKPSS